MLSRRCTSGAPAAACVPAPAAACAAALALACLAALAPAPARAGEVIAVDGDRAVTRHDPLVPSRRSSDLRPPPAERRRAAPAGRAAVARVSAARARSGTRAVVRALRRAWRKRQLARGSYSRYLRAYAAARRTLRRLRGARAAQLRYVLASLEGMALRGHLRASRMPVLFVQLRRNAQYWRSLPYPRSGDRVSFRGSEILFQYYPGRGLQLQPLATFKKANLMHGACHGTVAAPCRTAGLRRLLDEMSRLAVRRHRRFIAWEYLFHFGGGSPPWISGMAQASGIQALARASGLLRERRYLGVARKALGAFSVGPPAGVRVRGPTGGVHYLHYSFAPRFYVFNGFLQALIGLYDYAKIAGDSRAAALYRQAEPEARREIPHSDTGSWSLYSWRGRRSTGEYHELLREFLQSMCNRRLGAVYCRYARLYRSYQQRRRG